MSGQGPYFGQAIWFHASHPEDLPSAKKRYIDQILRVWEVLDTILKDRVWLVGDKWCVLFNLLPLLLPFALTLSNLLILL